jgi:hypothetical protein
MFKIYLHRLAGQACAERRAGEAAGTAGTAVDRAARA